MDLSLTLEKIRRLETKLENRRWLEKNPDKEQDLKKQLHNLQLKIRKKEDTSKDRFDSIRITNEKETESSLNSRQPEAKFQVASQESGKKKKKPLPKVPLAGFDESDLKLYIPIAEDINRMIPNATLEEKLEAFRTAPELQENFQKKIKRMIVEPLQELQLLESLKQKYLDSSSSKEKANLKREIDRLEARMENDTPFKYSDSFYCGLRPLSDEELAARVDAVGSLPDILVSIYKQRNGLREEESLELAIKMDYYEPQLQLLGQAGFVEPLTDDLRESFNKGYDSLPLSVQNVFSARNGLESGSSAEQVLNQLLRGNESTDPLMKGVKEAASSSEPEYNDIDFVDRSRFLEEFYPAIGSMEGEHPSRVDIDRFVSEMLDKKTFMVTSKPERVAGGYYIRGVNLLLDDEDGGFTAADKLVAEVSKKLQSSDLGLEFFYILDPSPPTDEELEFGSVNRPLFVVTSRNRTKFYSLANPSTKALITISGLLTTFFFSVGACALNPSISDRFTAALDSATSTGVVDLKWLSDMFLPIFMATLGIQLSHEVGHRFVAHKYKVYNGTKNRLPNLIPSITTGLTGTITPLKSPPPNLKCLFDFAVAGPLAGLTVSLPLLLVGLEMTSSIDGNTQLPVLPVDLVRASSLGGGMVQFFLGNAVLMKDQGAAAMIALHPLAIAGFLGCMVNSLALLPLGHTDGGRISIAMFGRRGAFVVKLFTTLLLCAVGLVGLDQENILLIYVLFASIWQRELETPMRNEVDELDFIRGLTTKLDLHFRASCLFSAMMSAAILRRN
eukprot:scaffold25699_cov137-Cylindrotheca_fusiformis.AAC.11